MAWSLKKRYLFKNSPQFNFVRFDRILRSSLAYLCKSIDIPSKVKFQSKNPARPVVQLELLRADENVLLNLRNVRVFFAIDDREIEFHTRPSPQVLKLSFHSTACLCGQRHVNVPLDAFPNIS